jgi:Uma2 family endonuclease
MLDKYCGQYGLGEAFSSPADIELSPKDLVQPDVFVVPKIARSWRDVAALSLAVEVISPSTARTDRHDKKRRYQRERVPEYWIVDLDARIVERWRPDDLRPEVLLDSLVWQPDPGLPALTIDLPEFFRAALAE